MEKTEQRPELAMGDRFVFKDMCIKPWHNFVSWSNKNIKLAYCKTLSQLRVAKYFFNASIKLPQHGVLKASKLERGGEAMKKQRMQYSSWVNMIHSSRFMPLRV